MPTPVATVRPYAKPAIATLTSNHVVVIDHPTEGLKSMSYVDFRAQLDAAYTAAQAACATSQSATATSATAAATSATNAASSATGAATSASTAITQAATATTQASTATTQAATATTQAATATTQASAADTSATAAAGSASAAATSASGAASSATTATTQAGTATTAAATATTQATTASTAATTATTQATNAANSATAAATSASTADTSQTNAATSETNAANSATSAANSATSAATSANTANTQAAAAAASAVTAAATIAANYLGGIAGASVPATAAAAGKYYSITSAGTSQGKTWVIGDQAIYTGTSGSWTQISGWYAYADNAVLTAQLLQFGYIQSDGATANRAAGIYGPFDAVNNPREWIAGAASLTIAAVLTVPTGSNAGVIFAIFDQTSGNQWLRPYSFYAEVDATRLAIVAVGAGTTFVNCKVFSSTAFKTTYGGKTGLLKLYFVQGSTNPVVSWNGVDITASMGFTLATTGTPPAWLDAAMVPTYRLVGYNWPAGPAPIVTPILGQTSAADDAFFMQTGKWPAWVVAGGTTTKFNTADFTVGAGTGTLSANTATSLVCAGATTSLNAYSNASQVIIAGQKIRANLTVSGVTGSQVFFTTDSVGSGSGGSFGSSIAMLANGTADYDLTVTASGTFFGRFIFTSTTAASVTINSFDRLGALSIPSIQPVNVVDDISAIGGNQGYLLGITPICSQKSGIIRSTQTASSYLKADMVLIPSGYAIESLWVKANGSVALGGSTGTASDVFASFSPTSGTWVKVLDPGDSSTGKLYATLGTATYAQFRITVSKLD